MTFAEAVQRLMESEGIDGKTLAEKSGVNAPYISKLLNGKIKEPTWTKACAIIGALGMEVDEFRQFQTSK